jgi:hypothetical protein
VRVLFVRVSVVARHTSVSVASGSDIVLFVVELLLIVVTTPVEFVEGANRTLFVSSTPSVMFTPPVPLATR